MPVIVEDNSDQGGLKLGQIIQCAGHAGNWKVIQVDQLKEGPRAYVVERIPNRQQRRLAKKKEGTKS